MSKTTTLTVSVLLVAMFGLESASAGTIEEVLVTARKRVESVQEVPVAIQAFTAEDIERYKATNLQEITELASQVLAFGQSSGNGGTFFIRGQGTGSLDPGLEASVTVNIDGVQVDRGHIHRQAFFDLDGVQVLKGPQALFFGKNSPAGVIALTSAGPTDEFEASFQGGYEFDADEAYFEAAVSGPLSDQARARLAYRGSDSDGYLKNTSAPFAHSGGIWPDEPYNFPGAARSRAGGQQSHAARLTLDWTPNDNFGAVFKLMYTDFETDNFATIENISCSGPLPVTATLNGLVGLSQGRVVGAALDPSGDCRMNGRISAGSLPPEVARNYPGADKKDGEPYGEYESVLASANLEWDFDKFSITSVTGYYWYDYTRWDNFDGTSFIQFMGIQLEDQATFSQELRLATQLGGDWDFMFGGFYENFERDSDNAGKIFAWGVDPVTGFSNNWAGESTVKSDSYSVFGQATWQFSEDWELAFGSRFTRDDRKARQGNTFVHSTAAVFFPGGFFLPAGQVINSKFDDDNVSSEVTLTWRPYDNITLWAAYKEGYKAGGFSTNTVLVASATPRSVTFEPEEADGFELGIKSILLDGRLRANATIYSYDFKDLQVSAFDNATTSFRITNAASSESTGIEFDFEYLVTERFTLRGQAGYNDGEYNDFTTAPCFAGQTPAQGCNPATGTQDRSGTRLGFAPEWSGSLGFEYRQPIGADLAFQISYDAIFTDEYVTGGHPLASQDSFWKHNARAGIMSMDDTWSVMFIGRNLSEEWQNGGCADKPGGGPGDIFCQVARARQLILQASYRM